MQKSYSEKLAEFKQLGPFTFIETRQYHAGDEYFKPECDVCHTHRAYHFTLIADREGDKYFVGDNCRRHIKIQYHLPEGEYHGNS
jgi:alpha-D-ribose 1-methylphosphonate 5-phosphate C-P lyase